MKRKNRGRFWHRWHEHWQEEDDFSQEVDFEQWLAWQEHFANFMGTSPDKHWLFGGRRFKPWFSHRWGPPAMFNPFVAELMSKGGGLLPLYVLHLISQKPSYGNDIMRAIESRTNGKWTSNPGAIYPLLNVMEDRGLIIGEWEDPDKRTRRVYRITDEGELEYERLKEVMRPKLEEAIAVLKDLFHDLDQQKDN